jgi:hypothetical protein
LLYLLEDVLADKRVHSAVSVDINKNYQHCNDTKQRRKGLLAQNADRSLHACPQRQRSTEDAAVKQAVYLPERIVQQDHIAVGVGGAGQTDALLLTTAEVHALFACTSQEDGYNYSRTAEQLKAHNNHPVRGSRKRP